YARRGVTANAIAPGFIASAMTDKLNEKQREAILARVPAGQLGSGADVAAAAVYLASEEAGYVNGQTIHVNGGMAMIGEDSDIRPSRPRCGGAIRRAG